MLCKYNRNEYSIYKFLLRLLNQLVALILMIGILLKYHPLSRIKS